MKTTQIIALGVLALGLSGSAWGQEYNDVVRFSRPEDLGSARYTSMGGAFSALGNDFSAVGMNPAGLAVYRMDEMSISGYFRNTGVQNTYYDQQANANFSGLTVNQVGYVNTSQISKNSRFNLGLRYSRTNNYRFDQEVYAENINSSVVNQWWDNADYFLPNGGDLFETGLIFEQLAQDVGLIDYQNNQWEQYAWGSNVTQEQIYESRGGKSDLGIDLALQYDEHWYFGLTLGIPTASFSYREVYTERNYDASSAYQSMEWRNNYDLTGAGFKLALGAIYTSDYGSRLSAYFHTPTWWNFQQTGSTSITSTLRSGGGSSTSDLPYDLFNWKLTTPLKAGFGFAQVFGQNGLISIDYSIQGLQHANARATYFAGELDYLNDDIEDQLQTWHDLRAGMEWRIKKWFIRGGAHYTTSPYVNFEDPAMQYAGGFGFKDNKWGIDFAYSLRQRQDSFDLYSPAYTTSSVSRNLTDHFFITTVYFRI